jgi:streptogramin lyase
VDSGLTKLGTTPWILTVEMVQSSLANSMRIRSSIEATDVLTTLLSVVLLFVEFPSNVVGTGKPGDSGEGRAAAMAEINGPFDVVIDASNGLIFSDTGNHRIKRVDLKSGDMKVVAGSGSRGFSGDGGPAKLAKLDEPYGLAVDAGGTIYFADRLNRRVRMIEAGTGTIRTVAGNGAKTYSGDGGPATEAGLVEPNGLALDGSDRLLIADVADHRIRAVDLKTGRISTLAGTGKAKHDGDGGPARAASIHGARAVKVGPDGTIWILERQGNSLRAIDRRTGTISTRAGTGKAGYSGDDGPALEAIFNGPKELCLDASGNVYVVDTENHAIRRIDVKSGRITTVAGDGHRGGEAGGCPDFAARLDRPHGAAMTRDGALLIGDTGNHRILKFVLP